MNIVAYYLLLACLVVSETNSPFPPYVDKPSERHVATKGVVKEKYLTILGIKIGKSMGSEVMAKYGDTDSYDGKWQMKYVCYKSSDTKDNTVVEFGANFAIYKFAKEIITEITVGIAKDEKTKLCTATNKINISTSNNNDIRLGMEKDEFKKMLGKPTYENEEHVDYDYDAKKKFTKEEIVKMSKHRDVGKYQYWYLSSSISGHFVGSKLVWYRVSYVGTY